MYLFDRSKLPEEASSMKSSTTTQSLQGLKSSLFQKSKLATYEEMFTLGGKHEI